MIPGVARLRFRREVGRDRLSTDVRWFGALTIDRKIDRGAATPTATSHLRRATLLAERFDPRVIDAQEEVEDLGFARRKLSRRSEVPPR